jgi:hypothetical protein
MRRTASGNLRSWAVLAAAVLAAAPAAADGHLAVQGGGFVPWQGDAGPSFLLQLLGSNARARARFGGELEFRTFDSQIIGVSDVDVEAYVIRAVWQQHFVPDAPVTPYLGLGLGVAINDVDDRKVDRVKGRDVRSSTSAGPDGVFMLGLAAKLPGADFVSVYAEGRIGFSVDYVSRNDATHLESENLGGASGNAGLRFRF